MRARLSLATRVVLVAVGAALAAPGLAAFAMRWLEPWTALAVAAAFCAPVAIWAALAVTRPWTNTVKALKDGIASLRDHDFSLTVSQTANDELGGLVSAYNELAGLLRRERLDLHQRELMLDTVIHTSPLALVLTNANGRIVFSNVAARQLLHGGRKLEGLDFTAVLSNAPPALLEAVTGGTDTLFTVQEGAEANVFHLSQRGFVLNAQAHRLTLLKQLTREMAAQEVAVWKKVIRVIAHELNNSLAPISSLASSGLMLTRSAADGDSGHVGDTARLERVFTTIADRAAHLATFIDGYARFAKLPKPRIAPVSWRQLIGRLDGALPFRLTTALPEESGAFDATQLEQVLINLLKNAAESGSPPEHIELSLQALPDGWLVEIADRGSGFSEDALKDALLPFYSTKASGTGLGLTLCREIVEAHGGRVSLANRAGGGAVVSLWLPRRNPAHPPLAEAGVDSA